MVILKVSLPHGGIVQHDLRRGLRRRTGALAAVLACLTGLTVLGTGVAVAAPTAPSPAQSADPASTSPTATAMRTVAQMQPSWNLGNTLDAIPDETSWGNPLTTKALFDTLKSQGFRSIRIP